MPHKPQNTQTQTQTPALAQTLAPLQVQFVKLLELTAPAVEDEVRRRLDENPALEADQTEPQTDVADEPENDDDFTPNFSLNSGPKASYEPRDDTPDMHQQLLTQLADENIDPYIRQLATYVIGNLDNNGRLTRTLPQMAADIAQHAPEAPTTSQMVQALAAVQRLDPAGVGAADLRECLLLQLERMPQASPAVKAATAIVGKHFDLFAAEGPASPKLKRQVGADAAVIAEAAALIRTLNPKPGVAEGDDDLASQRLQIVPDFNVEPDEASIGDDGLPTRFDLSLNQRIPELSVAQSYQIADDGRQPFIRARRREASEFIELLRRRSDTLMAVLRAIVSIQSRFFATDDPADIQPMILRDIAQRTGLDLSVISRATAGKYVATPGGVYPLKMLFNERPNTASESSARQIMHALSQLIANEDPEAPLNDDALAAELRKTAGADIARRTVAKYREAMGIANSRARLRAKNHKINL